MVAIDSFIPDATEQCFSRSIHLIRDYQSQAIPCNVYACSCLNLTSPRSFNV